MSLAIPRRRLSAGVETQPDGTASVRVWAPACRRMDFAIDGGAIHPLEPETDGFFRGIVAGARAGHALLVSTRRRPAAARSGLTLSAGWPTRSVGCRRRLDVHVDGRGVERHRSTGPGPLRAARRHVHASRHVGRRGGRARRARRSRRHGHRDDARRRLRGPLRLGLRRRESLRADAALRHARRSARASSIARTRAGLGVILDVVYNHLGPDGNYLAEFSPDYFTDRYTNDWGRAINFEGAAPRRVRSSSRTPATGSTSSISTG